MWGDYRFAAVADGQDTGGLKVIDLGAGHSSSGETLCGRVLGALKSEELLNEFVGAAYIERNWPPALKESAAWPLVSLRQSFLNGSLTRLVDPDAILKTKIVEFVDRGDFGLASGRELDGNYERVWFEELVSPDDVAFDAGVFLLRKDSAKALKVGPSPEPVPVPSPQPGTGPVTQPQPASRTLNPGSLLAPPRRPCTLSERCRPRSGTAWGPRSFQSCELVLTSRLVWSFQWPLVLTLPRVWCLSYARCCRNSG